MHHLKNNKFSFKKAIIMIVVLVMLVGLFPVSLKIVHVGNLGLIKVAKSLVQAQAIQFNKIPVQPLKIKIPVSVPVGMPVSNPSKSIFDIFQSIFDQMNEYYKKLGAFGFKQALNRMVHNIAVDSAIFLVTGDKGQAPMFQTSFVKYIKSEGDAFLGDALNNKLKKMWGVNLCEPINAYAKLNFELAVKKSFHYNKPQCGFTTMMKNIGDLRRIKLVDLPKVAEMFNPNGNELGMFLEVTSRFNQKKRDKEQAAKFETTINEGFKAVKDTVSEDFKTPAAFVKKIASQPIDYAFEQLGIYTGELGADFIGPFTDTLVSKLMKKYLKKGLYQPSTVGVNGRNGGLFSTITAPIQAAKERFADLGRPNYNFGGPFDLIAKLSCNGTKNQYNCIIDKGFQAVLLEAPYLTVQEAMDKDKKLLHKDWPFGFRADKNGGTDTADKNIYSYRSLVILRKYRIIPVGWELAAQYYVRYDKSGLPLTLQKLVDNYGNINSPYYHLVDPKWVLKAPETICNKQGSGDELATENINYEYDFNQNGIIEQSEKINYPIRLPYCADERSCIQERSDGNGCLYYGYCTEEKPIWRIQSNGGECTPVYNTCRAYTTRAGQRVGYLNNTVWGQNICKASNAGCREYSKVWDIATQQWSTEATNKIYLNKEASACSVQDAGCNRFIRLKKDGVFNDDTSGQPVSYNTALAALQNGNPFDSVINYNFSPTTNLKKAPTYLGCAGYTTEVVGSDETVCTGNNNFWRNDLQKCVLSGNAACAGYALSCGDASDTSNVGCQFYTPKSYLGPMVPGVVGIDNYCPAECVGYHSYIKQPSFLERTVLGNQLPNLIADTAITCSAADNGCEEFTNLSEGTQGENKEYFSAIRSCILPDNSGVATYYSWASTAEAGNQLKSWQLLATNSNGTGMPCTNSETASDGTVSCVDNTIDTVTGLPYTPYECSFGNPVMDLNPVYNSDCVEYTASTGDSYWMLYSRVISTSEGCVPMRRTNGGAIYSINQQQSQNCQAVAKDCREYKGSAANNIKIVLADDFEDGTNQAWNYGNISTEALTAGGHSLLSDYTGKNINKEVTSLMHQGKSYKLSFWAKNDQSGTADINSIYLNGDVGNKVFFDLSGGGLNLSTEWNRYEVNLNNLAGDLGNNIALYITWQNTATFYIDNIILTETIDDLYLIADSWQTPASCDDPLSGAMLGCEAYQDQNDTKQYVKSFTKLCQDELVGCEAMVDTYNNSTTTELTFNNTENTDPQDDVLVPADDLKYLVYDNKKSCTKPGCTFLGIAEASRDNSINFTNQYVIADAQSFGVGATINSMPSDPLCLAEENWCDEFTRFGSTGGVEYFINPSVFTCEYKVVNGNYGWYISGENVVCPTINVTDNSVSGHCLGGRSVLNTDTNNTCSQATDCSDYAKGSQPGQCSQWTGICPAKQNNCTEYQDPVHPNDCDKQSVYGEVANANHNNGVACDFYYYQSDKVETCNAEEDLGNGCQAFHQTNGGVNQWYSSARCTGDPKIGCDTDADCVAADGTSLGNCAYTPSLAPAPQNNNNSSPTATPVAQ